MAKKTNPYVSLEIEWMESKLSRLQELVDEMLENPDDRYGDKELPNGRVVRAIISSKEEQITKATSILEKIPKMIQGLAELRIKEEALREAKGNGDIPYRMRVDGD